MPYLTAVTPEALKIGAVNTIAVEYNEREGILLTGHNTDVTGFTDSLRPLLRPDMKRALILGSGGASKAVAYGLRSLGIEPVTVSRTAAPGRLSYGELTPEVMASHLVIVNTTPLGMWPDVDSCPDIPYSLITPSHLCYDLIYNPDVTAFMRRAADHGATVKNGLEMLLLQAFAAWQIWQSTNAPATVAEMM